MVAQSASLRVLDTHSHAAALAQQPDHRPEYLASILARGFGSGSGREEVQFPSQTGSREAVLLVNGLVMTRRGWSGRNAKLSLLRKGSLCPFRSGPTGLKQLT